MDEILTSEHVNFLTSINLEELLTGITQTVLSLGGKILLAVLAYFVGHWAVKRINRVIKQVMNKREVDASLCSFIGSVVNITLNLTLIIVVISILGIETSSFIALFATAGLAIGMALQGTLQNFAGGVMILLFKPYKVGDFIEAQGQSGTVKEIQIFNTILTTSDNKTIIVPNSGLSTGIMTNYSTTGTRRIEWTFVIGYSDSYDKAKEIIERLLSEDTRIKKEPEHLIALSAFGESSFDIVVRVWVNSSDFWDVFYDMNENIHKTFAKEGIDFPLPQLNLHMPTIPKN